VTGLPALTVPGTCGTKARELKLRICAWELREGFCGLLGRHEPEVAEFCCARRSPDSRKSRRHGRSRRNCRCRPSPRDDYNGEMSGHRQARSRTNCADFVHDVVTFLLSGLRLAQAKLGDSASMTPKQSRKSFSQFAKRNPQLSTSRAFFAHKCRARKASKTGHGPRRRRLPRQYYFLPLAVFQPFVAGRGHCFYFGGRFEPPAHRCRAMWTPDGTLVGPLSKGRAARLEARARSAFVKSDPSLKSALEKTRWRPARSLL